MVPLVEVRSLVSENHLALPRRKHPEKARGNDNTSWRSGSRERDRGCFFDDGNSSALSGGNRPPTISHDVPNPCGGDHKAQEGGNPDGPIHAVMDRDRWT